MICLFYLFSTLIPKLILKINANHDHHQPLTWTKSHRKLAFLQQSVPRSGSTSTPQPISGQLRSFDPTLWKWSSRSFGVLSIPLEFQSLSTSTNRRFRSCPQLRTRRELRNSTCGSGRCFWCDRFSSCLSSNRQVPRLKLSKKLPSYFT